LLGGNRHYLDRYPGEQIIEDPGSSRVPGPLDDGGKLHEGRSRHAADGCDADRSGEGRCLGLVVQDGYDGIGVDDHAGSPVSWS
jgi:hypothetical protein